MNRHAKFAWDFQGCLSSARDLELKKQQLSDTEGDPADFVGKVKVLLLLRSLVSNHTVVGVLGFPAFRLK